MKADLSITVRGKSGRSYSFPFQGNPKYLKEWREDGLEINELCNTIPVWVVRVGLARQWCFVQDVFRFRNPFIGW